MEDEADEGREARKQIVETVANQLKVSLAAGFDVKAKYCTSTLIKQQRKLWTKLV